MSASVGLDSPVLLYDGTCGFCSRSVQFVLAREPVARRTALRFAPLESAFGRGVLAQHPPLASVDSVVWYDASTGRVQVRSDAALSVARHLGGVWRLLAIAGGLVPRAIRDAVYDVVARNRHRLAGESCLLPDASQRARFLA
jgi:predicted DCC family thiol-disulfide oxidoreductase YuxK